MANKEYQVEGYCEICEANVRFSAMEQWFRDFLLCPTCGSVPRERALMEVLKRYYPNYRKLHIHESSPCDRGVSRKLARECRRYSSSHYIPGTPRGLIDVDHGIRSESLESLTFPDASFDLFITQDVLEHIFDPEAAFREIARVLRPGGAHIFSVPLVQKFEPSRVRAHLQPDGNVEHVLEPQFHRNPIDSDGSLVVTDWGFDIARKIEASSGMPSHIIHIDDLGRGVRAEFIEIVVSFRR